MMELHPLCTLFPRLAGAEFEALREDIATNGLREPIVTHDGMILDGGNRYRACMDAGVKPTFKKFTGASIGEFVRSANLHRRHLSIVQQAAIVATIQDWSNAHQHGGSSAPGSTSDTTKSRAEQSGASVSTQRRVDAVAKARPELAVEVAQGKTTLAEAVKKAAPQLASRQKPAKRTSEPTIESLTEENKLLKNDLHEARDTARALALELESFDSASGDIKLAAKELLRVKGQLATVETQRDQWMTTCGELRKEVKSLQRKLGKSK